MSLLEVRGLVKSYGRRRVVDGVNFDVNAGEVVGLLGPNGAGKTTSFRMTTGQISPNEGQVFFNGQDVTGLPMFKRARLGMGYLSQETSVFRKLTVEQNILAILEIMPRPRTMDRSLTRSERWDRTDKVLEQFSLSYVRKNMAGRLSGGEKRRLEIARCLVCEPLLILLDEPFTGIDPKTIADIQQIVVALRKTGIGVLLTDHNVREALRITTRSYLIKDGKVRTHGTPIEIINDPIAIQEYLGTGFNDNVLGDQNTEVRSHKAEERIQQAEVANINLRTGAADRGPVREMPAMKPEAPHARTQADQETAPPIRSNLLEHEKIQRLIDGLKTSEAVPVAAALVKKGTLAIPALLAALERRDLDLRRQAHQVLQQIVQRPVIFDPFAPETLRMKQLSALRDSLMRKAG